MLSFNVNKDSPDYQRSLYWTLPGFGLQVVAEFLDLLGQAESLPPGAPGIVFLLGTTFFIIGLTLMARSKARSPVWAVLGLLSLLGWFFMALLEDKTPGASEHKVNDI
jgi:hypothetical protein